MNLENIINNKEIQPTIINENSNFVVVTYWWGRNVNNQNTSRPCIAFFETINRQIQEACIKTFGTSSAEINIQQIYNKLERIIQSLTSFKTIINNTAKSYNAMIFEHLGIPPTEADKYNNALVKLEKMKSLGQTPQDFEFKNEEYSNRLLTIIMLEVISMNKSNFLKIYDTNNKITELRDNFLSKKESLTPAEKNVYLKKIDELNNILKNEKAVIKKKLNTKQTYSTPEMLEFNNMSIYDILHKEFRFISPMTYDKMITKWENECAKYNCNYMAVEYPEFTLPGGYQMAINAKPLFIKKSLEACGQRGVLYIDGDMFIRKYPKLFDLQDVDFMARGWWIDARSSWKMEESITYDPYTFETSGGTMFFSQSIEAKGLISKWIETSAKSYQQGKADDRILSLVFNTYKLLCSMKVIQLPIEYLWLTLDYDERMLEYVYDYDAYKMKESIIIEHSECLTSEDTASGSGASSDRTPKFYSFLDENLDPVSEQFHEYMMFPSADMVETFKPYLKFMSGLQYINDGNELLVQKGFVNLENPEENEQPLYITSYEDKFSNLKYPQDTSLTYNTVAEINMNRSRSMNTSGLGLVQVRDNIIEINDFSKLMKEDDPTKYSHAKIISLIIKLLQEGKTVIYNPTSMSEYDKSMYDLLLEEENSKYKNMELIFAPEFTGGFPRSGNYFYKPLIQVNQAIMFKPSEMLIKFLMMFLSLEDFSSYINNGSYEFMSRVRVGYIIKKTQKKPKSMMQNPVEDVFYDAEEEQFYDAMEGKKGGALDNNTQGNSTDRDIDLYIEGVNILYKGGRRRRHNKRRNNVKRTTLRKKKARKSYKLMSHTKNKRSKQNKTRKYKGKKRMTKKL